MDEWESFIESYRKDCYQEEDEFGKVLKNAEIIFEKDLASFETEWILSTLLQRPVNLIEVITDKHKSGDWSRCILKSLKLLSDIVAKYDCASKYYEEIVTLCLHLLLPYDAKTWQQALSCLTKVVSRSPVGARNFNQHLLALEMATTCKAPLLVLIGAICEHHPDVVEPEMTNIWRVFLNYMDFNKNSETVIKSVLEGVMGLFKHFEMELPTMELNIFYDKLVTYLDLPKCEKTVLRVLQRHAPLFRERLRGDARARARAWCARAGDVRAALRAVYGAVADVAEEEDLKQIISTEIEPRTTSQQYNEKFTALYILSDIYKLKGIGDMNEHIDIQAVEFDIRSENINYETCEAVSWCVQANVLFCDRLLQTAMLFYDKFVALKRSDVIIDSILLAEKEVRTVSLIYLISETCRSPSQRYTQLWDDLLNNTRATVLEHAPAVVDEVQEYVWGVLEGMGDEAPPEQLGRYRGVLCALRRHARAHAPLARSCGAPRGCANLSIEQCLNDEDKLQCALALIEAPDDGPHSHTEMIIAIEIIFSRNDTEAKILSKGLQKLEKVIQGQGLNGSRLNGIIRKVENRSRRIDRQQKDERILYRDITIFLGKYGERDDNPTELDSNVVAKLKNKLSLELPCQNTVLKINLKEIIYSALESEDVDACKTLCAVICANLSINKDEILQSVLIRVLVCLSHSKVDISCILSAVSMCDAVCASELIEHIIREKSTRSRIILLEALEVLLQADAEGLIQQNAVENIIFYEDEVHKQAILDVIEKLLQLLKGNNLLCKKYLPEILIKVLKSQNNLIETVTEIFIDKIELYDMDILNNTIDNIIKILNDVKNKMADPLIKIMVQFIKNIFDIKDDRRCIMNYCLSVSNEINLSILVKIKQIYQLDFGSQLDDFVLSKLFCCNDYDEDDGIFEFIAEYADKLVDLGFENTYKLLSRAIEKLTPEKIIEKYRKLTRCLSSLKMTKNYEPILIKTSLENTLTEYPIKEITESVHKYIFETKHEMFVQVLNIILDLYDGPILMQFSGYVRKWLGWIMKLNATGHVEMSLKPKMAYLFDLVGVSLKYFDDDEILDIISKEEDKSGVLFLSTFMPVTFKRLVKEPYKLLLSGLEKRCLLLNDVVRYAARRNRGREVAGIVDALWPTYTPMTTFDQKYWLLLDLMGSELPETSNPMQWVLTTMKEGSLVEKIKLVVLLPPGSEYDLRGALAPHVPPLRELRGAGCCALRALLDALAQRGQPALLDCVAALLEGDDARGWWDDAIDMCMSSLAPRADMRLLRHAHARSERGAPRVSERLLLPLLRYTKLSLCEEFMSSILDSLILELKMTPRDVDSRYYEKYVLKYIRILNLIQIIFEKIPKENIESPRSVLYSKMTDKVGDTPFYLIRNVCKLCFTLRSKVLCPEGADENMVKSCRLFQCVNYNCLVTAILLRDPQPEVYSVVFDADTWNQLVGDEDIQLPIREQWNQRVTRHAVSASLGELRTRTRSDARTRMFTRTLSENPLAYDLLQEDEQSGARALQLADSPLNRHACAAALCALLAARGERCAEGWLAPLQSALRAGRVAVRWLLAQAVCNSREQLRAHAGALQPALLAVVLDSAGGGQLNGLHVDILDTIILWQEHTSGNATVIEYIINTAIDNKDRSNVYWTLVDRLAKLLDIWKEVRPSWTCFERHLDPNSDTSKVCLKILKRITKCGVLVPELPVALVEALEGRRYSLEVYELFGLVLALDEKRDDYVTRYLKVLQRLRKSDVAEYVKMLCYVQRGYPPVCDDQNFRLITDLTPKISTREKLKCLEILSTYVQTASRRDDVVALFDTVGLGESLHTFEGLTLLKNGLHLMDDQKRKYFVLQVATSCRQLSEKLRPVAYEILTKALQLLLPSETSEPPAKRLSWESKSLILGEKDGYTKTLLEELARGVMGSGGMESVREGVGRLLDEELGVRLCESFHLAVLNQTVHDVNPAAILNIFFHGLRGEKLKNTKLRDEPIAISEAMALNISRLNNSLKQEDTTTEAVNVTMTLDVLLDSLLKFSERNVNAAISLLVQLIKAHPKRPGFDFPAALGASLVQALGGASARWAAAAARAALWACDGLKQAIDKLLKITRGSEDEGTYKLLEEDYKLRHLGPEQFILGSRMDYDVDMPHSSKNFTVKDLVSAFGKLSNWDNLTIQQKNSIKIDLPPMWTSKGNVQMHFDDYDLNDGPAWMKCMLSAARARDGGANCLRDVQKWPRRLFDISAVSEISTLESIRDGVDAKHVFLRRDIHSSECLAEWAARIMIRSMHLGGHLSRSHAFSWCERASERGLHAQVLECCKANIDTDLYESETLQWFRQRARALRARALERNDSDSLRSALRLAVTYTPQFIESSSFGDVLGMNEVILTLRRDLKLLTKDHTESALQDIKHKLKENPNDTYDKKVLESVCVTALTFYDRLWEASEETSEQNGLLLNMSQALNLIIDLDLGVTNLATGVIINRLDAFVGDELQDEVAEHLLDTLQLIIPKLDAISLDHLKAKKHLFKKYEDHETMKGLMENVGILKFKMCLNLVGDAEHLLLHYTSECVKALEDEIEWSKVFGELKRNIFENPYAGPDYKVLEKYKTKLYDIADYDKQTKKGVLSAVQSELRNTKRESVSLSHVCPALSTREITDDSLNKLLCLKPGVNIFKFEEKIPIFTDSIRRPAVLAVRLSDGSSRRYIVKRGEPVRTHCAAVRLLATVQGGTSRIGYHVTQLSDDSALIEYLEDHERFSTLISSHHPIDDVMGSMTRARGKDSELILALSSSLRHFEALCSKVPPYVLRSAIEDNSASVKDFISKKYNFLEAVCTMTIFSYLCGVGDRHLANLMYGLRDGRACHVDCGALLRYGAPELPPARLTRNVLAACDTQVLESRLQSMKMSLRESSGLILPTISVVFKWMGDVYVENLSYISNLIQGKSLAHLVTIDALSKSTQPYKENYIQLLEDIFGDFDKKETYSVEEQVSNLLRQCTDPRILSVTRSGWEPWI